MGLSSTLHKEKSSVEQYRRHEPSDVSLWWLGQAGFLMKRAGTTVLIDAYLSNFLAEKYKTHMYPHQRMMQSPIRAENLTGIDYCISTHTHSDHLDPGLIPILAANCPDCRFVLPESSTSIGRERGIREDRLIPANAGVPIDLSNRLRLVPIPSAHEELRVDQLNRHLYLGYILETGGIRIYHSGDCVPYPGLDDELGPYAIDLALLPVNGRRPELSARGIAGNFNIDEAIALINRHGIGYMIAHHIGMFDFNTADPDEIQEVIKNAGRSESVYVAKTGFRYRLVRQARA